MSDERAESCESASISNGLVLSIAIVLVASFTPLYLPCLTCSHTHRMLLALILATSYSLSSSPLAPSLTLYSSLCIVQLPGVSVTLRAALTMLQSSSSSLLYPTCYCPHRQRPHHHPPHSCCANHTVLIASYSLRRAYLVILIISYSIGYVVFANVPLFPCKVW